jgi:hypothetical protein
MIKREEDSFNIPITEQQDFLTLDGIQLLDINDKTKKGRRK